MRQYGLRLAALKKAIARNGLDSFLVTGEANVSYLSGFGGRDSLLLLTTKKDFLITDSRYVEEAQDEAEGFEITLVTSTTYETISNLVRKNGLKKTGFEAMNLPFAVGMRLKSGKNGTFTPTQGVVEGLRAVKDAREISLLKKAARLTKRVFALVAGLARPGVSERSLSVRAETEFIRNGAKPSFEPIIVSGRHCSKPHARPTDAKVKDDTFVMIDIGCSLNRYNADMTRMVTLGKAALRFRKICSIVAEARERALAIIKPGVKISDVDIAARAHIAEMGFERYFGHALGHGVGMEVHEEPRISQFNHDTLKTGMVFTVEPAIYIPGFGGARVEDMVHVTADGYEILTG